jgi:predicted nucleic acid-binding Zn ribbon protein
MGRSGGKQYPAYEITCEQCGTVVRKSRPDARFCSTRCQQKAKYERTKR